MPTPSVAPPAFGEFAPPAFGEVVLEGLPEARELNGARGVAIKTISDGRTVVKLEDGRELAFRSENLRPVDDAAGGGNLSRSPCTSAGKGHRPSRGCGFDAHLLSPTEEERLVRVEKAVVNYHDMREGVGEDNARWLLDGARCGDDEALWCIGVPTPEEAESVLRRVLADLALLVLDDDPDLA
mmetsp:Transcript_54187/g.150762  ORF Transcript_54187/g.150762 Transcript_54187/m.150762 type:complete len:183 (+) Transcript_54187:183-731(+)